METSFGEEMDHKYCVGEEALVTEKGERKSGMYRGMLKENTSSKPLAGKMGGADFCEFLQPAGQKNWTFKDGWAYLR